MNTAWLHHQERYRAKKDSSLAQNVKHFCNLNLLEQSDTVVHNFQIATFSFGDVFGDATKHATSVLPQEADMLCQTESASYTTIPSKWFMLPTSIFVEWDRQALPSNDTSGWYFAIHDCCV
eukprot:2042586-Amphidinium_carterae.1